MPWSAATRSGASPGKRKWSKGPITRDVFSAEKVPVDMKKIKQSHAMSGSQRRKKEGNISII
jgi:hypothetical protein